ncbi:MAG: DHH family phosphoesterase [Candidatus Aenigmarchaeota archaeon]|nr:DHH family phosphoesterase [Candidatus Aenigmarchaeota archaeon]
MPKTLILTHADSDGICAGAIALAVFPGARVFFTKPVSLLEDLKNVGENRIILCDIALEKRTAKDALAIFSRKEVMYFDHHPLPSGITEALVDKSVRLYAHDEQSCGSELAYRKFAPSLPPEMVLLAIYGAIGDYTDSTRFVQAALADWEKRTLYFEIATLVLGMKGERFSGYDAKREIVRIMAKGGKPSDMPGLVEAARDAADREFELYDFVKKKARQQGNVGCIEKLPRFGFRGAAALFAATATGKPVGIAVYKRRNYLDITIRRRGNADLHKAAEKAAEAVGGSGGGHPEAAGARIPKDRLEDFLKALNRQLRI